MPGTVPTGCVTSSYLLVTGARNGQSRYAGRDPVRMEIPIPGYTIMMWGLLNLLDKGATVTPDEIDERVVDRKLVAWSIERYPHISMPWGAYATDPNRQRLLDFLNQIRGGDLLY